MEPVVVVGAGIAGVACAREVAAAGLPVRVLDRGRRVGGRMAAKHWEGRPVDLGAAYLTAQDGEFAGLIDDWHRRGLAHPWTDSFTVLEPGRPATTKAGPLRWAAPGALRSLVEDLAADLTVEQHEVTRVGLDTEQRPCVDGRPAAAVVLAMPDRQAARLLEAGARAALDDAGWVERDFEPVLALATRWAERTWDDVCPEGRFHAAFVNGDDALGLVADDGRRRRDDAPVLVAHSTPDLARAHYDDPPAAVPAMLEALRRLLGVGEPEATLVHRWGLARPTGDGRAAYVMTPELLGLCGDGWGRRSRVETAWASGRALGRAVVARVV